jgi:hypothetical protein
MPPYGRSCGSTTNTAPRALSSSQLCRHSSVVKEIVGTRLLLVGDGDLGHPDAHASLLPAHWPDEDQGSSTYGSPHPAGGAIPEPIRRVPRCRRAAPAGTLMDMSRVVRRYRRILRHLQQTQTTAAFA